MMKKIASLLSVAGFLLLTGCGFPPPTALQLPANPDYGPPPPQNYKEMVQSELSGSFVTNVLWGSAASSYEFYPPAKGYTEANHMVGVNQTFGWVVCGTLYRKERYSAYPVYDGPLPFYALFKDGKIAEKLIGQTTYEHTVPHILNDDVKKVCARAGKL